MATFVFCGVCHNPEGYDRAIRFRKAPRGATKVVVQRVTSLVAARAAAPNAGPFVARDAPHRRLAIVRLGDVAAKAKPLLRGCDVCAAAAVEGIAACARSNEQMKCAPGGVSCNRHPGAQ